MGKLQELGGKLREKREALQKVFTEAGPDMDFTKVSCLEGDEKAKLEKVQEMNRELAALHDEYAKAAELEELAQSNAKALGELNEPVNRLGNPHAMQKNGQDGTGRMVKTLGELFVESQGFKGWQGGNTGLTVELESPNAFMGGMQTGEAKTLMTTAGAWAVQPPPISFMQATPMRRLVVADLFPQRSISTPWASWMEETTFTNNAAITDEGAEKPESALAWTRRDAHAVKIANSIPVTTEQLEDIPGIQGVINGRLTQMVRFAEEVALLNSTNANLTGFTQLPDILTQARGTDNNVDTILKLFTQIEATGTNTAFAEPNFVVMHPTNFLTVRLMKSSTGDYIWGPPSEEGGTRMWGVPVVRTPGMTVNTALVGDSSYAQIDRYKNISVSVGWVNNQFRENERTILAEERIILEVYRQQAFGLATGLN